VKCYINIAILTKRNIDQKNDELLPQATPEENNKIVHVNIEE